MTGEWLTRCTVGYQGAGSHNIRISDEPKLWRLRARTHLSQHTACDLFTRSSHDFVASASVASSEVIPNTCLSLYVCM